MKAPKILIVKPPLDGHDRPIYDLIKLFREHGIDPIWTGLRQPWPQIVKTAVEEDVDAVGVSVHTGDPVVLLGHLKAELDRAGFINRVLVAGGSGEITFPDVRKKLAALGFKVFLSGIQRDEIAKYILRKCKKREQMRGLIKVAEFSVPENHFFTANQLTQAISLLERNPKMEIKTLQHPFHTVVLCGTSGAGKSSILNRALEYLALSGKKIGVLLCDPRGPKEKGAFLGDRLVLQDHTSNGRIFIRSFSQFGGYTPKHTSLLKKSALLLSAWGAELIFIETIGLAQESAAGIKNLADILAWVTLPNETDDVRLLKGGIHEIADVILLNKIDLEPWFRAELAIKEYFHKPYFKVSAMSGKGIVEFCEYIKEKIAGS